MGVFMIRNFALSLLGLLFSFLFSSSVYASDFCLQNAKGMSCLYTTELECELVKKDHEFCVENPLDMRDVERHRFEYKPIESEGICYGQFCIFKYVQEKCNEVGEKREDLHSKCGEWYLNPN